MSKRRKGNPIIKREPVKESRYSMMINHLSESKKQAKESRVLDVVREYTEKLAGKPLFDRMLSVSDIIWSFPDIPDKEHTYWHHRSTLLCPTEDDAREIRNGLMKAADGSGIALTIEKWAPAVYDVLSKNQYIRENTWYGITISPEQSIHDAHRPPFGEAFLLSFSFSIFS